MAFWSCFPSHSVGWHIQNVWDSPFQAILRGIYPTRFVLNLEFWFREYLLLVHHSWDVVLRLWARAHLSDKCMLSWGDPRYFCGDTNLLIYFVNLSSSWWPWKCVILSGLLFLEETMKVVRYTSAVLLSSFFHFFMKCFLLFPTTVMRLACWWLWE